MVINIPAFWSERYTCYCITLLQVYKSIMWPNSLDTLRIFAIWDHYVLEYKSPDSTCTLPGSKSWPLPHQTLHAQHLRINYLLEYVFFFFCFLFFKFLDLISNGENS